MAELKNDKLKLSVYSDLPDMHLFTASGLNTDTGKETTNYMETLERKLGSASKADSRMFGLSAAYGFAAAGLAAITAGILLLIL